MRRLPAIVILLLASLVAAGQDVASFEKRITVKKLPNGLTVLVCERHEAPVFSFFTHVDAGSAQDERAASGRQSRVVLTPRRWRQACRW